MKRVHIDITIASFPVKGTITIVEAQDNKEETRKLHTPASEAQEYTLKKAGLWRADMSAGEAFILIRDLKKPSQPKTEPLPWEMPIKRGRGRPRKNGVL